MLQRVLLPRRTLPAGDKKMPTAFVLINTDPGSEMDALKNLRKIGGVEEAHAVYGTYDIVLRAKADTMDKLKETISAHIRKVSKVRATLTLMSSEDSK
jgi:DNA-binding Lrp family transcriptional regulator